MIVHDEKTIDEALKMFKRSGPVRYSDEYMYAIITNLLTLEDRCQKALERNDIVIVVPVGEEKTMEDYAANLRRIRERRRKDAQEAIREWVSEHPTEVQKARRKLL